MIELLILTTVLVVIAVLALSVRLIFTKKGDFRGGSCNKPSGSNTKENLSCGCARNYSCK